MPKNLRDLTTDELIIMIDSLTDYLVMLRTDKNTQIVASHDEYIKRDLTPRVRDIYLTAYDLRAQFKTLTSARR